MNANDAVVEIYFRLRRDECPDLFEHLIAVAKGTARAQRLKILTVRGFDSERLLSQQGRTSFEPPAAGSAAAGAPAPDPLGDLIGGRVE